MNRDLGGMTASDGDDVRTAVKAVLAKGLAMSAMTLLALPAMAQQSGAAQEPRTSALEEIVVTAQKREERLQDVPLSIAAVGQRELEQKGIGSLDDLARNVAGMQVIPGMHRAQYTIRGITTATIGVTTSSASGLFVDEYPLYDTWFPLASPDPRIIDVQRVEVLRGPQGTLFGASSLSGDVRVFTNKPDLSRAYANFELMGADVSGGSPDYLASAVVNAPMSDGTLGLRASAWTRQDGGYIDYPGRGTTNTNELKDYGARVHLKGQPNEQFDWLATLSYEKNELGDQAYSYYFPPPGATDDNFNYPTYVAPSEGQYSFASLTANWAMDWADLTVSGMYGKNEGRYGADITGLVFLFAGPPKVPDGAHIDVDSNTKIFEARLASDPSKSLRYVAGAYFNRRSNQQHYVYYSDLLIPRYGTNRLYEVPVDNEAKEYAAYGQVTWAFADRWEATAGVRYSKLDYHAYFNLSGVLASAATPTREFITDIDNNDSAVTPRFSLAYKVSPDMNLYATASKGFRFGLTNYNTGASAGVPLLYKPDSLWNYEIGEKATLMDGRMSLNSALYYITWKDIQISFRNQAVGGVIYVTNAGAARSYGLETEMVFRATPELELNATLALGTAEISEDDPGIPARTASGRGPAVYGVTKGMRLPGAAEVSGSAGIQYNWFGVGSGEAYARLDGVYVGPSYIDFMKEGSLEIGGYGLANLRLGYKAGNYEFIAFVNNMFDDRTPANAMSNADRQLTDAAYRVRPRTIGLTIRAKY